MVKWLFYSYVQDHEYLSQKELNVREVTNLKEYILQMLL